MVNFLFYCTDGGVRVTLDVVFVFLLFRFRTALVILLCLLEQS